VAYSRGLDRKPYGFKANISRMPTHFSDVGRATAGLDVLCLFPLQNKTDDQERATHLLACMHWE
jgi:hypothetical protein